ncbi:MAG TPA: glutamate mutase L, partial [Anaerolineae bacterium]
EAESISVTVRSNLGMGGPVVNLLDKVEPAAIARWTAEEISEDTVRNFVYNKSVHPQTIPMTEAELHLEHAIAREIIHQVAIEAAAIQESSSTGLAPSFRLLLARGATLVNAPRPGQALLILLDALQPGGIFSVALDQHGLLPALGMLASREPLAVVQALEAGILLDMGWVVVPIGPGQTGQEVINVTANPGGLKVDVHYGEIAVVTLAKEQPVEVSLQPARRFDIGFGPGQGRTVTLRGGAVGLVVDARGRPLSLPQDEATRREKVRQWLWDMGA